MNVRYVPDANVPVLAITKPLSAALRDIMKTPALVIVPDGVDIRRVVSQFHRRTSAPVKPVGIAGVGNSVGKVSERFVTVVPALAYVSMICHVTRLPLRSQNWRSEEAPEGAAPAVNVGVPV